MRMRRGVTMAEKKKAKEAKEAPEEKKAVAEGETEAKDEEAQPAAEKAEEAQAEPTPEGHEVETAEKPVAPAGEEAGEAPTKESDLKKPLDKMTAKELREVALGIPGISGVHAMKKEDLLAAIHQAWGIAEEKAPKKKAKAEVGVAQLKAKIQEVKGKRAEALQKKDKRLATIYRRRINRLKKRTRRAA
jgi:hypothetical protein